MKVTGTPSSSAACTKYVVDSRASASIPLYGVPGGSSGPGAPVPHQRATSVLRRLPTSEAGLWPCQVSGRVAGSPNGA